MTEPQMLDKPGSFPRLQLATRRVLIILVRNCRHGKTEPFKSHLSIINGFEVAGRGERIRTSDLSVPNRAHYQAVLRPESRWMIGIEIGCVKRD